MLTLTLDDFRADPTRVTEAKEWRVVDAEGRTLYSGGRWDGPDAEARVAELEAERDRLAAEAKALESSVVHWQSEHAKAVRRAVEAEAERDRVVATERARRAGTREALAAIVRNLPTCQHVACPKPRTVCGSDGWFYCDEHAPGKGSKDIVGGVNPMTIRQALTLLSRPS